MKVKSKYFWILDNNLEEEVITQLSNKLNNEQISHFVLSNTDISENERIIRTNNMNMAHNGQAMLLSISSSISDGVEPNIMAYVNNPQSKEIANVFTNELGKAFSNVYIELGNSPILKYSHMPSVLIENQVNKLNDYDVNFKVIDRIFEGIMKIECGETL